MEGWTHPAESHRLHSRNQHWPASRQSSTQTTHHWTKPSCAGVMGVGHVSGVLESRQSESLAASGWAVVRSLMDATSKRWPVSMGRRGRSWTDDSMTVPALSSALEGRGHDGAADMSDAALLLRAYENLGRRLCLPPAWRLRLLSVGCSQIGGCSAPVITSASSPCTTRESATSSLFRACCDGSGAIRRSRASCAMKRSAISCSSGVCAEASQTSFADVSRVPPAHRLSYSLHHGFTRVDRYWSLETRELCPVRRSARVRRADSQTCCASLSEIACARGRSACS